MKEEINHNIKQKILFYIKENNFKSAEKLILKEEVKIKELNYKELNVNCHWLVISKSFVLLLIF